MSKRSTLKKENEKRNKLQGCYIFSISPALGGRGKMKNM